MHFIRKTVICLPMLLSGKVRADDSVGLSAISLPDISNRYELGLLYQKSYPLETPFLTIDRMSFNAVYYPKIKLIEPSTLKIENDHIVLKKGNSLDFDAEYASLLLISPRLESCFISETVCILASPLSFTFFAGGSQIVDYFSPVLGLKIQHALDNQVRWFSSFEFITFEEQSLLTAGLTF